MNITDDQIIKFASYVIPLVMAWLLKLRRDVNAAHRLIRRMKDDQSRRCSCQPEV